LFIFFYFHPNALTNFMELNPSGEAAIISAISAVVIEVPQTLANRRELLLGA
jgi:hypothetical protein